VQAERNSAGSDLRDRRRLSLQGRERRADYTITIFGVR